MESASERDSLGQFQTFEDYLDSQVGDADRNYIDDAGTARALVELGFRGTGAALSREEFEARKRAERERHQLKEVPPRPLASLGKDVSSKPLLMALAAREELVRNGKLSTIVYVRDVNARGQEVSAYIDYAHRLKTDLCEPMFEGKAKLVPRPSDLSFYNWDTGVSVINPSPNFSIISDAAEGLLFKAKRDRKVLNVDPRSAPGEDTTRTEVVTDDYLQVVIFDHYTRARAT